MGRAQRTTSLMPMPHLSRAGAVYSSGAAASQTPSRSIFCGAAARAHAGVRTPAVVYALRPNGSLARYWDPVLCWLLLKLLTRRCVRACVRACVCVCVCVCRYDPFMLDSDHTALGMLLLNSLGGQSRVDPRWAPPGGGGRLRRRGKMRGESRLGAAPPRAPH